MSRLFLSFFLVLLCFINSSKNCTTSTTQESILLSSYTVSGWSSITVDIKGIVVDVAGNHFQLLRGGSDSAVTRVSPTGNVDWVLKIPSSTVNSGDINLLNDQSSLIIMVSVTSGIYILKVRTADGVITGQTYFADKSLNDQNTDLRLSPSGLKAAFSAYSTTSKIEVNILQLGDFATSSYYNAYLSTEYYLRDLTMVSDDQVFLIGVEATSSMIHFKLLDFNAANTIYDVQMDWPTTTCNGRTSTVVYVEADIVAVGLSSDNVNMLQFMKPSDGTLIGNQWRLTTTGGMDHSVSSMAYANQKVYMASGKYESSASGTLIIFDRTTSTFKLFSKIVSNIFSILGVHPTSGEIVIGEAGNTLSIANTRLFNPDYIEINGDYRVADPSLVFVEVTDGSEDLHTKTGVASIVINANTNTATAPSSSIVAATLVTNDLLTVNIHPVEKETTLAGSLVGATYDLNPFTCVGSYSTVAFTEEAYGNDLDGTSIVTAVDSATGALTIDTPATAGTYSLAVRATYSGGLTGFVLIPVTINTLDYVEPVEPVEPVEEKENEEEDEDSCLGLSKLKWGLTVTGIVIGLVLGMTSLSIFVIVKYMGKPKPAGMSNLPKPETEGVQETGRNYEGDQAYV